MADATLTDTTTSPRGKSLFARVVGIIVSPRETYADVAAHPRVLGALLLVLAVGVGTAVAFGSTQVGKEITLDETIRLTESLGVQIPEEQYQRMEDGIMNQSPFKQAIWQVIAWPIGAAFTAALVMLVFNAILGYAASFRQIFAVVVHSLVVVALQLLIVYPIFYLKESMSSPTSLTVFLPFLDEGSFAARFLGAFDLLRLWWIANFAIGLGALYKKSTKPILIGLLSLYVIVAFGFASIAALFSRG